MNLAMIGAGRMGAGMVRRLLAQGHSCFVFDRSPDSLKPLAAAGAKTFDSLQALGLKLGAIALCALPVATGWLVLSMALGRIQERRAEQLGKAVQGD